MNKKKITSFLIKILLFVFSILIVCIVGEFLIRIFSPQALMSDLMQPCPNYGLCMKRNITGHQMSKEYNVDIRLNSFGFRGKEFSLKPEPKKNRILMIGDSFIFGYGVSEDQTLAERLGRLLETKMPQKYEVLNLGQLAFGTGQEFLKFQEIGLLLQPSAVVLNVYLGNDLYENRRLFNFDGTHLIQIAQKPSRFERSRKISKWIPCSSWLRENSHLFRFIGLHIVNLLGRVSKEREEICGTYEIELYQHILSRFNDMLKEHKIRLFVTLIPYHPELNEYLEKEKPDFQFNLELKYYREAIKKKTLELNLPVLDFYEYFSNNTNGQRRYFMNDPHWNTYGNEQATYALYDFLIKQGFLEIDINK